VGARSLGGWALLARDRSITLSPAAWLTLKAVVGSRLIVWVAGLAALAVFGRNTAAFSLLDPHGATAPFHSSSANFLFAPAARWDSVWYLAIAHVGYYSRQSSGMFPLYPLLIHLGSIVFRSELLVGLAISLVSMTAGLYALNRLVALDLGERTARTTVLLLALFPVALFFSAVYTESLYLFLSIGAIYAARTDGWAWAGTLGALGAATRSAGVVVLAPLALMYLYGPRAHPRHRGVRWWRPRYRLGWSVAWLALVPVGLLAYLAYLGVAHGDPFATFGAQAYWGRHFAGPFGAVVEALGRVPGDVRRVLGGHELIIGPGDPVGLNAHNLIDLGFVAFAVLGLVAGWRRVPFAYLIYAVLLLVQALSYPVSYEPLASISRYILVIFPVFIGWALLLERRPRLRLTFLGTSAVLLALFSGLWATWAWIA
jgi:hypothetical protein